MLPGNGGDILRLFVGSFFIGDTGDVLDFVRTLYWRYFDVLVFCQQVPGYIPSSIGRRYWWCLRYHSILNEGLNKYWVRTLVLDIASTFLVSGIRNLLFMITFTFASFDDLRKVSGNSVHSKLYPGMDTYFKDHLEKDGRAFVSRRERSYYTAVTPQTNMDTWSIRDEQGNIYWSRGSAWKRLIYAPLSFYDCHEYQEN